MAKWKKVASVTPGGKPYFYARPSSASGKSFMEWALWNREYGWWEWEIQNLSTGESIITEGFGTAKAAMAYADEHSDEAKRALLEELP